MRLAAELAALESRAAACAKRAATCTGTKDLIALFLRCRLRLTEMPDNHRGINQGL
jgi:hypothetical protein